MHWGDYGWGMGFGWIFMIIFWVLIILVVIYLVRLVTGTGKQQQGETPIEILKKRYAKGEITKEEFEKMKGDITKD
ncbi:MAG: SHOCT domain-containing protein [Syntrophorhabdaceae bacterium]|nr:SHOCT domain-containing protein [Syntrophorhabdaceae bacterium]MDD5244574.1 SHOCT domain-containing protein [Syntrophorhabdaceae bacterium]